MKKMAHKLWFTGILTLMLFAMVFTASAEAGGDFATAQEINVNEVYTDNISAGNDDDYFVFTLPSAGSICVELSRENLFDAAEYWKATIYDINSNFIADYSFSGNVSKTTTYKIGLAEGSYFIKIRGGDAPNGWRRYSTVDYNFSVNYSKSDYWEKENNEAFITANKVELNKMYSATINRADDVDLYRFALVSDGYICLDFERSNLFDAAEYWIVTLYDINSNVIAEHTFFGNENKTTTCKVGLVAGTYFIRIRSGNAPNGWRRYSTVNYSFNVNYTKSDYWEKENNEDFSVAGEVLLNKKYSASINRDNDVDFYKFTLKGKTDLSIQFFEYVNADSLEYYIVYIYDSSTNEIAHFSVYGNSLMVKQSLALHEGTYYIKIRSGNAPNGWRRYSTNDYSIYVGYTEPGKPSKITTSASTSSIKLSWSKVSGATGYRIYKYNTKTKKYETLKTLSGTSYTIKNLNPATIYKFKIKAYKKVNGETIWGDASSAISVTTKLAVPKGIKTAQSTKAIKLSWKKVTGADGYRIYQYNSKTKKWEKIKNLKGTSYKVQKLKAGTTYKFKIKAYRKGSDTIWSAATSAITVATKPLTPAITAVASTAKNRMAVSWKNVSGESGYQVYASTKKDTGYKKVITAKANVVKGVRTDFVSGRTYYLKVRAFTKTAGGTVYSAWSAVKSIKIK